MVASFVDLPETAFEIIAKEFDDVRDVLNLELVHSTVAQKLKRVFWGTPWTFYLGQTKNLNEASTSANSQIVTFNGRVLNCGQNVGIDELVQVRHLKQLYIGPPASGQPNGPGTNTLLHKFLTTAAKSEITLRKIELIYRNPELMLNFTKSEIAQSFPSKKTHTKITNLIDSQSEYLNELNLFLNVEQNQWISVKRNQAKIIIDYNCKCTTGLKQIFYPILTSFSYDLRKAPQTLELKICQEKPEAILAALDYCLSTFLSGSRARRAIRTIKIHLVGASWTQIVDSATEIIPKGMRHLEMVRWHFDDEKVINIYYVYFFQITNAEFNEMCCRVQTSSTVSLIISTPTQQRIIGTAEASDLLGPQTNLSTKKISKFTKLAPILVN